MQRYFIKENQIKKENDNLIITIDESDSHHIKDVMRMNIGDKVIASIDGNSPRTYLSEIISLGKKVEIKVLEEIIEDNELKIKVTIAHGLVRKDKQEEVIRRLVELGCYAYTPVNMARSVVKMYKMDKHFETDRLSKIVKEASEQSERNRLMKLNDIIEFDELIDSFNQYDLVLFASATDKNDLSLKEKLNIGGKKVENILVIIGPEGGFSNEEIEKINSTDAYTISLGKRVLRTETAPLYAMSVLSYEGERE